MTHARCPFHAPTDNAASEDQLRSFILEGEHPCLGARSVFHRGRATVREFGELGSAASARSLRAALHVHAARVDRAEGFASFIAAFPDTTPPDEVTFEHLLWEQLQLLHDVDEEPWNDQVSRDPDNPEFALSVDGTAYFVVGLHPNASRLARRAPVTSLVFNFHSQFEELRSSGKYDRMRDAIRARDAKLQGEVNPMAADFGTASDARQYSGRQVGDDWTAPFVVHDDAFDVPVTGSAS